MKTTNSALLISSLITATALLGACGKPSTVGGSRNSQPMAIGPLAMPSEPSQPIPASQPSTPVQPQSPQGPIGTSGVGGVDSSGGNLTRSTEEQFATAFERSKKNVAVAMHRLSYIYNDLQSDYDEDDPTRQRAGAIQGIVVVSPKKDSNEDVDYTVEDSLTPIMSVERRSENQRTIETLNYVTQNEDCTSKDGHRDASASIDGTICLNVASVRRLPPESLELHLTALMAHETAHVLGASEAGAQLVQNSLLTLPAVAIADSKITREMSQLFKDDINTMMRSAVAGYMWLEKADLKDYKWRFCGKGRTKLIDESYDQTEEDILKTQAKRLFFSDLFFQMENFGRGRDAFQSAINDICEDEGFKKHSREQIKSTITKYVTSTIADAKLLASLAQDFENYKQPFAEFIGTANGFWFRNEIFEKSKKIDEQVKDKSLANLISKLECTIDQNGEKTFVDFATVKPRGPSQDPYDKSHLYQPGHREIRFPLKDSKHPNAYLMLSTHQLTSSPGDYKYKGPTHFERSLDIFISTNFGNETWQRNSEVWSVKAKANVAVSSGVAVTSLAPGLIDGFSFTTDRSTPAGLAGSEVVTKNLSVECHFKGTEPARETKFKSLFLD